MLPKLAVISSITQVCMFVVCKFSVVDPSHRQIASPHHNSVGCCGEHARPMTAGNDWPMPCGMRPYFLHAQARPDMCRISLLSLTCHSCCSARSNQYAQAPPSQAFLYDAHKCPTRSRATACRIQAQASRYTARAAAAVRFGCTLTVISHASRSVCSQVAHGSQARPCEAGMLAPYSTPHAPFTQVRSHAGIRRAPCGLQPDRSVQRSDGYAISRDPRRLARSRFMLGHVYAGYCLPALGFKSRQALVAQALARAHARVVRCA